MPVAVIFTCVSSGKLFRCLDFTLDSVISRTREIGLSVTAEFTLRIKQMKEVVEVDATLVAPRRSLFYERTEKETGFREASETRCCDRQIITEPINYGARSYCDS